MPLDRIINLEIRTAIKDSNPAQTLRLWADRQSAGIELSSVVIGETAAAVYVDFRIRWRQIFETTLPGLLTVVDENDVEYKVSSIRPEDARRRFVTLNCERGPS